MNVAKLPAAANLNWRIKHFIKRKIDQGLRKNTRPLAPVALEDAASTILDAPQNYIFFDIFDTLVQRTINPEHSKIIACQHLAIMAGLKNINGHSLYDIRRDLEARLCVFQHAENGELEFTLHALSQHMYDALCAEGQLAPDCAYEDFRSLLYHCELLAEKSVLIPVDATIQALKQASASGKTCILVSDFYLPAPFIRKMIAPFGILNHIDGLFVSCDEMASKRTGALYDIVLERLNIRAADVLMVGDNIWSDINNAKERGLNTLYLADATRKSFYASDEADVSEAKIFKQRCQDVFSSPTPATSAGFQSLAAPLLLFTERLYQNLRKNNQTHVFFLAREGQILEQLLNQYQDALGVPERFKIKTHYLLVSRRSTYIASLRPLSQEDFSKLFWQYRQISLGDFLRSLRFPHELIEELASKLKTEPDQTHDDFPSSDCFKALIKNKKFARHYEKLRTEQQENLTRYVKDFGVDFSKNPLTMVDVGWKGSIQDNLRKALPDTINVEGYYLGLIAPGDDAQHKTGLLFSNQQQSISPYFTIFAENRSLFEIILPADHASALNYTKLPNGSIEVELDDSDDEDNFVTNTVMPVAKEITGAFENFLTMRLRHVPTDRELEGVIASIHAQTIFSPTNKQLDWIGKVRHRENFGLFADSYFGDDKAQGLVKRFGFLKELVRSPRDTILGSFWPYHTLHTRGGAPVAVIYRWIRLGQLRWRLKKQHSHSENS